MIPTWDAHTEIDGAVYCVVVTRDGMQVAALGPGTALTLAADIADAAYEPARCMRDGCDNYATEGDLCGECAADPRTSPRWVP